MPGNSKKKQSYRSIHTDYKPFLKYIRNHSDIDDTTVERLEKKYGGVASNGLGDLVGTNTNTKNTNTNTKTNTNTMDTRGTVGASFSSQAQAAAASRKERDDARHADLHANYQHGSYTDGDKIFLLKREIDTLRSRLKEADPKANGLSKKNRLSAQGGSSLAPLSALLAVGLLLVVARTLRRRIARARAGGSLLEREEGPASVELGVAGVAANAGQTGGWRPLVPLEDA